MPTKLLPCLLCGKTFESVMHKDDLEWLSPRFNHQPHAGTTFYTYGHYGSTFWDSFDGEQCVICICDDCLNKNLKRMTFIKEQRTHPSVWIEIPFPKEIVEDTSKDIDPPVVNSLYSWENLSEADRKYWAIRGPYRFVLDGDDEEGYYYIVRGPADVDPVDTFDHTKEGSLQASRYVAFLNKEWSFNNPSPT